MRKSRKLDNVLDECLERLLVRGESVEQCLRHYPRYADELSPLLETILSAREASDVEPRPEFKARARYQFRLAVQEAKARKSRRFFGWKPAWATVVATVLTLVLASGVTVAAAGNSMPDELLYPVKVATEQLQLTVTRSPLSRAELYAKLADRRVAEIIYLANKGKAEAIESATRRLNASLLRITALSSGGVPPAVPKALLEPAPLEPERQITPPEPAPSRVSPESRPGERAPLEVSPEQPRAKPHVQIKRVRERARLRAVIARYARNHPEALRAALKDAPPSVRRALRRAIAISEARYKEASQALEGERAAPGERSPQRPLPERPRSKLRPREISPKRSPE